MKPSIKLKAIDQINRSINRRLTNSIFCIGCCLPGFHVVIVYLFWSEIIHFYLYESRSQIMSQSMCQSIWIYESVESYGGAMFIFSWSSPRFHDIFKSSQHPSDLDDICPTIRFPLGKTFSFLKTNLHQGIVRTYGTKEMLGAVGSKVLQVWNFAQQLPTICNRARLCSSSSWVVAHGTLNFCSSVARKSYFL